MVVAVIGGQLVDGFLGALPETQVRQWISQVLGAAGAARRQPWGRRAPTQTPTASRPRAAQRARADCPAGAGGPGSPGAPRAGSGGPVRPRRQPGLRRRPKQAMERGDMDAAADAFRKILASSPADPVAKVGLARVELFQRLDSYDEKAVRRAAAEHPDDVAAQARVADMDVAAGKIEDAFDRLLGVVRRTSGEQRDQARARLVGLFEIFPPRDPRVSKARAALSSLLF